MSRTSGQHSTRRLPEGNKPEEDRGVVTFHKAAEKPAPSLNTWRGCPVVDRTASLMRGA
jgi:hypothetical protein